MKKFVCLILAFVLFLSLAGCGSSQSVAPDHVVRLHIKGATNEKDDQSVKLKVRDEVVKFLTPKLATCKDKEDSLQVVFKNLQEIEKISDKVLKAEGFSYVSHAKLEKKDFPARKYGDLSLGSGEYDSLTVNLGTGSGDNWWCLIFPPLCFVGGKDVEGDEIIFKSKILEIIKIFKEKLANSN